MNSRKVAIVHDYLYQFGGAEKVVEKLLEMYPGATVYTSMFSPIHFASSPAIMQAWSEKRIHTTLAQILARLPFLLRFFKHFFWLYPVLMSFVTVRGVDAVIISSTYCAKNVRIQGTPRLVHYCHSPTRYLHGLIRETDLSTINPVLRQIIPLFTSWLKMLDLRAVRYLNSKGCIWIANSNFIRQTLSDVYHVDSTVIYPPIELKRFIDVQPQPVNYQPFYFYFGRITFHKKIDLIVQACLELGAPVIIAGKAAFQPEMEKLKSTIDEYEAIYPEATGKVRIIDDRLSDERIGEYLAGCRAFLFPAKEDSGMIPVEVLSAGVPVIAYGAGGALEYIKPGVNGVLFREQSVGGLKQGIHDFEILPSSTWSSAAIKDSARPFSEEAFITRIQEFVGT